MVDFSLLYRNDRRYDDALETIRQSETIGREIANSKFEMQHESQVRPSIFLWRSQVELGEIYREKGDAAAAEPVFERSLEAVGDLKMPPGNPKVAELLDNYATLLRDEEKYSRSEALYIRSLDVWGKTGRPENLETARTLTNYAALLRKLDRPAEAEKLEARSSAIQAKIDPVTQVN